MAISLLCDEHVPLSIVRGLCRRGINAVSIKKLDLLSKEDKKILDNAREEGKTIYTRDADFLRLHSEGLPHRGIIYNHPTKYSIGDTVKKLELMCQTLSEEEMKGKVKFL